MNKLCVHWLGIVVLFVAMMQVQVATAQWGDAPRSGNGEESGEEIIERFRYLHEKHAGGPGKSIAPDAYEKMVQEKIRFEQSQTSSPRGVASWTSLNPSGMYYLVTGANRIAGRTNSMAFHPTDPLTFYCAAAGGGVWKTTDGGTTWTVLTDALSSLMCGSVAIDPLVPATLYLGTGELNYSLDSYYGDGVFKSTNSGSTWTKVATAAAVGSYISQVAVDPTSSSNVYLSGSSGVYKSTNGGTSWSSSPSLSPANCILIDPVTPTTLFTTVGTGYLAGNVVKKSTDSGTSWTTLAGGLPSSSVGRIQLAMAPSDHLTLYASVASSSTYGLLGLYQSTDGGTSWTLKSSSPNYMSSQGWYNNAVCVHPTDPTKVIVGGLDNYRSTTSGTSLLKISTWSTTTSTSMSHADIHFLGYNGTVLYCGSDGGVYKSTNDGTTWTDLNATLSTLQYQSADYDPTSSLILYGGCQDNNKQTSTDGGTTWNQRTTGDGGYTVVDPVLTTYVYGQYVGGSCQRSTNSGVSFTEIAPTAGGLFYNPYEMAPANPLVLVYGTTAVYKTTTARTAISGSWATIASAGTVGSSSGVSAIGIGGTGATHIYIGTDNGRILSTTNNGTSWTTVTISGGPYVSDLAVDPSDSTKCYATFTGSDATKHVYKTTNAGVSWFSITSTLPNIPTNTIVVVPQTPRWLFVGTDLGVYQSTDDGTSWTSFNSGLPTLTIYDLKYKTGLKRLMAATHGRGCYMNDLTSILPIQLASFNATAVRSNLVRVRWGTLTEINNYGFEVQKSPNDPEHYQSIPNSFTAGHGTTNEPQHYAFDDATAQPGEWYYRLKQIDLDGTEHYYEGVQVSVLTSVAEKAVPDKFALYQNYPNPFNPATSFKFDVPATSRVTLKIYNTVGQEIATVVDAVKEAGSYNESWNAGNFASGVYYYKLSAQNFVQTKKFLLLR